MPRIADEDFEFLAGHTSESADLHGSDGSGGDEARRLWTGSY